jgi:hypothetical protein
MSLIYLLKAEQKRKGLIYEKKATRNNKFLFALFVVIIKILSLPVLINGIINPICFMVTTPQKRAFVFTRGR